MKLQTNSPNERKAKICLLATKQPVALRFIESTRTQKINEIYRFDVGKGIMARKWKR